MIHDDGGGRGRLRSNCTIVRGNKFCSLSRKKVGSKGRDMFFFPTKCSVEEKEAKLAASRCVAFFMRLWSLSPPPPLCPPKKGLFGSLRCVGYRFHLMLRRKR